MNSVCFSHQRERAATSTSARGCVLGEWISPAAAERWLFLGLLWRGLFYCRRSNLYGNRSSVRFALIRARIANEFIMQAPRSPLQLIMGCIVCVLMAKSIFPVEWETERQCIILTVLICIWALIVNILIFPGLSVYLVFARWLHVSKHTIDSVLFWVSNFYSLVVNRYY